MKHILYSVLFCLICLSALGQKANSDSIASLDWMIGKWSVEAIEEDSDNSTYKESGFIECKWELKKTVIKCSRYVSRSESKGRYANLAKAHSSIFYMIYNSDKQQFEQIRISKNGTRTQLYKKEGLWNLRSKSSFIHPSFGYKMSNNISLKRINKDLIVLLEDLKNEDGSFTERYESTRRRIE